MQVDVWKYKRSVKRCVSVWDNRRWHETVNLKILMLILKSQVIEAQYSAIILLIVTRGPNFFRLQSRSGILRKRQERLQTQPKLSPNYNQ